MYRFYTSCRELCFRILQSTPYWKENLGVLNLLPLYKFDLYRFAQLRIRSIQQLRVAWNDPNFSPLIFFAHYKIGILKSNHCETRIQNHPLCRIQPPCPIILSFPHPEGWLCYEKIKISEGMSNYFFPEPHIYITFKKAVHSPTFWPPHFKLQPNQVIGSPNRLTWYLAALLERVNSS